MENDTDVLERAKRGDVLERAAVDDLHGRDLPHDSAARGSARLRPARGSAREDVSFSLRFFESRETSLEARVSTIDRECCVETPT